MKRTRVARRRVPDVRRCARRAALAALALGASATLSADYEFAPLRIGGAGWVTGIAVHPTTPDRVYVRTDVGGAYAWQAGEASWRQLFVESAVAGAEPLVDYDVESIAVAASDDRVLYAAVGTSYGTGEFAPVGRILASRDGGRSWSRSEAGWFMGGNLEGRQGGERLAVDPRDADRVLFGSRRAGLWTTENGGGDWRRVPGLPAGDISGGDPLGIKWVLFDPAVGAAGRTSRVYASVSGRGVFRSDDGGSAWRRILANGTIAFDAEVASDGRLYAVFPGDSVRVYDPDADRWRSITPDGDESYASVAVDPFDPDRLFVAADGLTFGRFWRSRDGGASWETLDVRLDERDVAWRAVLDDGYLSVSSMAFDTGVPNRLWYPEGFGVFRSSDLDDDTVTWELVVDGIEELVSNDVVAPAGVQPLTAHWDAPIFRHPNPGGVRYDAELKPGGRFNSAWDLDYRTSDPRHVVAVVSDHRFCCEADGLANQSGFSRDGGRTWRRFASLENGTHPEALRFGNIAVAANDADTLVWLPSFDAPLHHSDDGGATWRRSNIEGIESVQSEGSHFQLYLNRRVLAADRVLPDTFYLYHDELGALRSTDGGREWSAFGFAGLDEGAFFNAKLEAAPGVAGDLWFTAGLMDGMDTSFKRSRDGGESWRAFETVRNVEAFGFGKPASADAYPTLFVAGEVSGDRGLWRSIDAGANWRKLTDAPLGIYDDVRAVTGDGDEFGTVYVGFSGVGFAVGRDEATPPEPDVGTGLRAVYFDERNFRRARTRRVDAGIDFDFGTEIPEGTALSDPDYFSIRWRGFLVPDATETVRLYTRSDDGVRVWVDGRRVIDNFTDHAVTEDSVTLELEAGRRYRLRIDYYEGYHLAEMELGWERASGKVEAIPARYLFPR